MSHSGGFRDEKFELLQTKKMNEERLKAADEEATSEEHGSRFNSLRKTVEKHGIYDERDAVRFEES